MIAERKERQKEKTEQQSDTERDEKGKKINTYLKPGAMLAQVPVRSQMQYGSREARQALERQKEKREEEGHCCYLILILVILVLDSLCSDNPQTKSDSQIQPVYETLTNKVSSTLLFVCQLI